jgi:prophage DNA circulation protein
LRDDLRVADVEKLAATLIEAFSEVGVIVRGKLTALPQTDLVEHARKIKKPLLALVRTARKRLRHALMMRPPDNEVHRHKAHVQA